MKNDVSSAPLTTLKAWLRVISATSSQSSAEGSRNIIGKGRCGCGSFGAAQQGGCSRMVTVWREAVSQRPRLLVNCAEHDFAWRNMKALQSGLQQFRQQPLSVMKYRQVATKRYCVSTTERVKKANA